MPKKDVTQKNSEKMTRNQRADKDLNQRQNQNSTDLDDTADTATTDDNDQDT